MQKKAEKCLNIYRRMEVVGRNKNNLLPFPAVMWIQSEKKRKMIEYPFTLESEF